MTKFYVRGATRMYKDKQIDIWIEAEENLGLKNSIFFFENGTTTQWVDSEEAEEFFEKVKKMDFNGVMDNYIKSLEKKDWVKFFECLSIMNEVDEHPEIADDIVLRRWMRIREKTHNKFYEEDLKNE